MTRFVLNKIKNELLEKASIKKWLVIREMVFNKWFVSFMSALSVGTFYFGGAYANEEIYQSPFDPFSVVDKDTFRDIYYQSDLVVLARFDGRFKRIKQETPRQKKYYKVAEIQEKLRNTRRTHEDIEAIRVYFPNFFPGLVTEQKSLVQENLDYMIYLNCRSMKSKNQNLTAVDSKLCDEIISRGKARFSKEEGVYRANIGALIERGWFFPQNEESLFVMFLSYQDDGRGVVFDSPLRLIWVQDENSDFFRFIETLSKEPAADVK